MFLGGVILWRGEKGPCADVRRTQSPERLSAEPKAERQHSVLLGQGRASSSLSCPGHELEGTKSLFAGFSKTAMIKKQRAVVSESGVGAVVTTASCQDPQVPALSRTATEPHLA